MSKYRKIDPRIWNDEKFRNLSDHGKLVFFFLLTHPHMTALGAMRSSVPGLAAEIGWKEKAFREAFREALSKGMIKADERASFIWFPNFIKYNLPESPNVVKAWVTALDLLPECPLKTELIQHVKAFTEGLPKAFAEAFAKGSPKAMLKTMPNQEQEQEQEQEKEREKEKRKRFSPPSISEIYSYCQERKNQVDANKFFDFYEAKGWMVGSNKMKDWKAAIRTWESRENIYTGGNSNYEYRNTYKRDRDNGITAETDRIIDEINREYRAAKDAAASQTGTVAK